MTYFVMRYPTNKSSNTKMMAQGQNLRYGEYRVTEGRNTGVVGCGVCAAADMATTST